VRKTYSPGLSVLARVPVEKLKHLVIYSSEAEAVAASNSATAARGCAPASHGEVRNKPLILCCPGESATSFSAARASCQT